MDPITIFIYFIGFVTCTKLYCMATPLNKKLLEVKLELVDKNSELDGKRRELANLRYEYTLLKNKSDIDQTFIEEYL